MKKLLTSKGLALSLSKGFTLIELLVVIAVLGVLAAVVLVAINPIEQLARGRDAGRKTTIGQLGNAVQAYYTSHNGVYPPGSNVAADGSGGWVKTLVDAGEIKVVPSAVTYSAGGAACDGTGTPTGYKQNGWCYRAAVTKGASPVITDVIVYTRMESGSEDSKCGSTQSAFFLWSSQDSKAGVVCIDNAAGGAAVEPTLMTYTTYQP